jgi:hypothetical protein
MATRFPCTLAAAWALPFFVGVYQKLYRVDVSQSKAAHKLRARIDSDLT